jgi:hypothetical protein
MSTKPLPGLSLLILLAGCAPSGRGPVVAGEPGLRAAPSALAPLVFDGPELHSSLVTRKLEDAAKLHQPVDAKETS